MNPFGKFLGNLTRGLAMMSSCEEKGTRNDHNTTANNHSQLLVCKIFEADYSPTHIHTNGTFSCVRIFKSAWRE